MPRRRSLGIHAQPVRSARAAWWTGRFKLWTRFSYGTSAPSKAEVSTQTLKLVCSQPEGFQSWAVRPPTWRDGSFGSGNGEIAMAVADLVPAGCCLRISKGGPPGATPQNDSWPDGCSAKKSFIGLKSCSLQKNESSISRLAGLRNLSRCLPRGKVNRQKTSPKRPVSIQRHEVYFACPRATGSASLLAACTQLHGSVTSRCCALQTVLVQGRPDFLQF